MPDFRPDIRIGNDEWITYIDTTEGRDQAREADAVLEPLLPFFDSLELYCVAGCCGVHAFDFSAPTIAEPARTFERVALRRSIAEVIAALEALPAGVWISRRMCHFLHTSTLLPLLRHIGDVIDAG